MKLLKNKTLEEVTETLLENYMLSYEAIEKSSSDRQTIDELHDCLMEQMWTLGHALGVWKPLANKIADYFNKPTEE